MMKTCLIVTGGTVQLEFAGSFLNKQKFDIVVAVDGGLEALGPLGLVPDAVVGDFDSVNRQVYQQYQELPGVNWEVHKPEKNETDTELAIDTAIRMGADRITILGATGGRIDHLLGNIHLLDTCLRMNVSACIVDSQNKVYLLRDGKTFEKKETWGNYISFVPLTETVTGITLKGFKYPLTEKTITIGREAGLCISNELAADFGSITFSSGILICVESCDFR